MLKHVPDDDEEVREVEIVGLDDAQGFEKFLEKTAHIQDQFAAPQQSMREIEGLAPNVKRKASREISKALKGAGGTGTKQFEEGERELPVGVNAYNLFDVAEPPHNLEYLAKLYEVSTAHGAAVRAKVTNIVGLGYEFKETDETKFDMRRLAEQGEEALTTAREQLMLLKGALKKWVEATNEEDSFTEVLKKVWTDVETTGNGYLEIGRKLTGEIGYIGHVPSFLMRVRRKRDGYCQIQGNKVVYFRPFGKLDQPNPLTNDSNPNEIIHFKKYSPASAYYGVPDIITAIDAIAGNSFAERYNMDYFEHKAVPRYLIILKNAKLSQDSEQRLLEFFQANLKGQHHRSLYVPLSSIRDGENVDFKIEPVEVKPQDASFIKFFQRNDDQILMAHRVPRSKVELPQNVSLAASRDADKNFKEQVCRPEQEVIQAKLRPIFAKKTDALKFNLKEMTLTDDDTASRISERRLKTQQSTPNEERALRGEMGLPGGDEVLDVFGAQLAEKQMEHQAKQADKAARSAERQAAAQAAAVAANPPQAEAVTEARTQRERDSVRSANASDSVGEARNPRGEGRQAP